MKRLCGPTQTGVAPVHGGQEAARVDVAAANEFLPIIQLAITPVILISGVGALMLNPAKEATEEAIDAMLIAAIAEDGTRAEVEGVVHAATGRSYRVVVIMRETDPTAPVGVAKADVYDLKTGRFIKTTGFMKCYVDIRP